MIIDPRPFLVSIAHRKAARDPEFAREYKKGLIVTFIGILLLAVLPWQLVVAAFVMWYVASKLYYGKLP